MPVSAITKSLPIALQQQIKKGQNSAAQTTPNESALRKTARNVDARVPRSEPITMNYVTNRNPFHLAA